MIATKVGSMSPKKYFPLEIGTTRNALALSEFGEGFEVGVTTTVVVKDIGTSSVFVSVGTLLLSNSVVSIAVSVTTEVLVAVGRPSLSYKICVELPR